LNGKLTLGIESEAGYDDAAGSSTVVYRITCHREDIVTICRNISVAPVAFLRFVPSRSPVAQGC